jgi:Uma2 family endonuclease
MTHSITRENLKTPVLENGDSLSREEFERRYNHTPGVKKAELIEGIVYMPAALRYNQHARPNRAIMYWLTNYELGTPGVECADNVTVRLDMNNAPQPDALLRIVKGGQSIISDDDYVEGPPELIVEIAASTVSIDLNKKLQIYLQNQVQEYLVWRIQDQEIDWFRLKNSEYIKLLADTQGIIKSEIFPGLWLDINSLLTGDLTQMALVLQTGLQTPEHQVFVEKINQNF